MGWYIVIIEVLITFFVSRLIYKKRYADLKTVFGRTLKNLRKDSVFLPSLLEWSKNTGRARSRYHAPRPIAQGRGLLIH